MILEEENRGTRTKILEKEERSTAGTRSTLSHETPRTRLGFSGERHNALTTCATRASQTEKVATEKIATEKVVVL